MNLSQRLLEVPLVRAAAIAAIGLYLANAVVGWWFAGPP